MPPKKHVVEEAPAPFRPEPTMTVDVRAMRHDFTSACDAAVECRAIVERVVLEVEEEIVLAHMDHMAVPWAIEGALTDLFEALHVAFVEREDRRPAGYSVDRGPAGCDFDVVADIPEPSTVPADSWSRGAIPKRKPLVFEAFKDTLNSTMGSVKGLRRGKDSAIRPNTPSVFGGVNGDDYSPSMKRPGSEGGTIEQSSSPSMRISRAAPRATAAASLPSPALGTSSSQAVDPAQSQPPTERPAVQTEEEQRLVREAKEASEKMKELKRTANRVDHALHDMKPSTPFVVDGDAVLLVNTIDPTKLPPREETKAVIDRNSDPALTKKKGQAAAAAAAPAANAQQQQQQPANRTTTPSLNNTSLTGNRGKPSGLGQKLFYSEEAITQPMITTVTPAAGVASREGEGLFLVVKKNELKLPKTKMTKADFAKVLQAQRGVELPSVPPEEEQRREESPPVPAPTIGGGKKLAPIDTKPSAASAPSHPHAESRASPAAAATGEAHDPELTPQPLAARPTRLGTPAASGGQRRLATEPQRHRVRPASSQGGQPPASPPPRAKTPQVHVASELFDDTAREFLEGLHST